MEGTGNGSPALMDHSSITFCDLVHPALADQVQGFVSAVVANGCIGGVVVVPGLQLIHEAGRFSERLARRIDFQGAGELTRGEVLESKMVVHVSQFSMTHVRIQLVRQKRLANRGFSVVAFKLAVQKLKARQVGFRELRVELLRAV